MQILLDDSFFFDTMIRESVAGSGKKKMNRGNMRVNLGKSGVNVKTFLRGEHYLISLPGKFRVGLI